MEVFILVLTFIILLALGVPIAFSIGLSGIITMLFSIDSIPAFTTFAHRMATGLDSFALLAIPFFILAGNIMNSGGIAIRLINFARVLVGGLPGGLALVNVSANMLFGAISGSAAASASAIGSIMAPEMKKEGYPDDFSTAVNVTSATTGLTIPPSNILIVYSLASGGASITALFIAGYIPGILSGLAIMMTAVGMLIYKTRGIRGIGRMITKLSILTVIIIGIAISLRLLYNHTSSAIHNIIFPLIGLGLASFIIYKVIRKWERVKYASRMFIEALPSLFMLVIIIGGIVAGYFTATEASAVAVLYALTLAFIYKQIKISDLPGIILKSVRTTAIVLLLVSTSIGLSWIMSYENIPQSVSEALLTLSNNPFVILLIINLILLFVGTFMDMTPAVLIFTPIFLPVVTAQLGMDPVHFGIIMVLNLCVGLCTPPVGSVLFIGCSVTGIKIEKVIRPLLPIFVAMIIVLLLVTYLPRLSLWLPELLLK